MGFGGDEGLGGGVGVGFENGRRGEEQSRKECVDVFLFWLRDG